MSSIKVLVCGDIEGNFKAFFEKITKINQKKGPFELLLCVGNFFGEDNSEWISLKKGNIHVPLPVYILGPTKQEHLEFFPNDSEEFAPNIMHLGKKGIYHTDSGLKIAYLSGIEGMISNDYTYNLDDILFFKKSINDAKVDILLTSQWPEGVTKYAGFPEGIDKFTASSLVSRLAMILKPVYHFAGLEDIRYERLPYRNHIILQETPVNPTRFIGLASFKNKVLTKCLYAFNIIPLEHRSISHEKYNIFGTITECPYSTALLKSNDEQFFFDMKISESHKRKEQNACFMPAKKLRKGKYIPHESCWFCLSNEQVEKQLIISIGENSYVALAKGGLLFDHLLIIPLHHCQASIDLPEEILKEIGLYKKAVVDYFHSKNKNVFFYERNYASQHVQIQVVPLPKSISSSVIKEELHNHANKFNFNIKEYPLFFELTQNVPKNCSYFYAEIVIDKEIDTKFFHIIKEKFPLQFARMVLASERILNFPERVDWKTCKESLEREFEIRDLIKKEFKPYEFETE